MKIFNRASQFPPILLCSLALGTSALSLHGATLSSIDFAPVSGAWGTNPTVRVDFGNGLGLGTITISSVNGGSFQNVATPDVYNNPGFSPTNLPTALSNGDLFAPAQESIFSLIPGAASTGLVGFQFVATLDAGNFTPGSLFSMRSFGVNSSIGAAQYVQPVTGLGAPLPEQLPTDGALANQGNWGVLDAGLGLYGNTLTGVSNGASKGLAFPITGNSFTVNVLATPGYNPGGVAWTIVTSPVPEPSQAILAFLGMAALGRRRRP